MALSNINGLKKLLRDVKKFGEDGKKMIARVTEASARDINKDATKNAPLDTGKLRQSIEAIKIDDYNWKVQANAKGIAPYAPFIEFGTGGLVEVPSELAEIAIQFKGDGLRKIDLKPQPYLYPAFVKNRKQYIKDLKDGLQLLSEKV